MGDVILKERLKLALERKNMKQAELVELTGIDKSQISSYLSGKYKPKQENLNLIAEALGVSVYWLMGLDEVGENQHLNSEQQWTNRFRTYAKYIYEERELEKMLKLYGKLSSENKNKVKVYMEKILEIQNMEAEV